MCVAEATLDSNGVHDDEAELCTLTTTATTTTKGDPFHLGTHEQRRRPAQTTTTTRLGELIFIWTLELVPATKLLAVFVGSHFQI